jgi:UDP-GlcNAc:undecaprenyl-phosphate GlcNAc-1-phosphate transferase
MLAQISKLFGIMSTALLIALLCGPLAIGIAKKFNFLDVPGSSAHKKHQTVTPLAGGILMSLSLGIMVLVFPIWDKPISIIVALSSILLVFGLADDAKGLSAWQKLIGQFIASVLLIYLDVSVHFMRNIDLSQWLSPAVLSTLDWVVTILWFVGITNAFNLVDSMDGLAVGIAAIAFSFFTIMAFASGQWAVALFSATCLGVSIGIFFYNSNPALFFLGDAGALMLGFFLASIGMLYTPPAHIPQQSSWFTPIMILGYPIFDTTLVVISRIRRRQPVFKADRAHFFHRMCRWGVPSAKAVTIVHFICIFLGVTAVFSLLQPPLIANGIFGFLVFAGMLSILCMEFIPAFAIPHDHIQE